MPAGEVPPEMAAAEDVAAEPVPSEPVPSEPVPPEPVPPEPVRRLILLRHAKSDWPDVPDRERPLAKRGRREAPPAGRWLRDHGYQPDVVVCSVARRTRQTWELIAPELGGSPTVTFDQRAYDAGARTLLYLARELPAWCRTALFVGHNPAVTDLANALAETPEGPPHLHFPTAAFAVLEFTGDWADLAPGHARLAAFTAPAGH
ncbi:MAG: histidine phosphatase family protein [Streptosporangiaceae bacterium]